MDRPYKIEWRACTWFLIIDFSSVMVVRDNQMFYLGLGIFHVYVEFTFETHRVEFLKAVYFRRGLKCILGLTNDLIDGGQPRAKPRLRKAK